jgi:hypothetical protein
MRGRWGRGTESFNWRDLNDFQRAIQLKLFRRTLFYDVTFSFILNVRSLCNSAHDSRPVLPSWHRASPL